MARPEKNNANYFSHDNDMRNDDKLKAVRRKFGHEGYSIWNMLLEKLSHAELFTLKYNELNIEMWAGDFEIEPVLLKDIIDYFLKIELLFQDGNDIFSKTMQKRFSPLLAKRKRNRDRFQASETNNKEVSDIGNTHSIVKETIVKEIKENKSIDNNIISSETSSEVFEENFESEKFPEGEPVKVTFVQAEEKKEESSGKEEKTAKTANKTREDLHGMIIEIYDKFIKKRTGLPAMIDGEQGNAAKKIIKYLTNVSATKDEEGCLKGWNYILDNWSKLTPYQQNRLKLSEITSDIVKVLDQIKNGNKGDGRKTDFSNIKPVFSDPGGNYGKL